MSAERRQLTIMFCDLVGSTALAARLEPEDLRDVLAAYQSHVTDLIHAAGGTVARYQGDGVLAYFGYPAAREDDAERAIGAGLELARGVETAGKTENLSVRVGIATGVVLVGDLLRSHVADSPPVTGETANLAARLQELASPATVAICDTTHQLAGALFEYRDLGLRHVKGLPRPIRAWQAAARSGVESRFRALRSSRLPCVGRDTEIGFLLERWAQARTGKGSVVVLSGDPGIGKSRLAFELMARVRGDSSTTLRYDCSPQHQNSMLHPVLANLRRAAKSSPGDKATATMDVLRSFFGDAGAEGSAAIGLMAELMALPIAQVPQGAGPDALERRALLFEATIGNLQRLARRKPLLIIVEDAHWADPTSRDLMTFFAGAMGEWPVLLVVTCRPEFEPPWRDEPHACRIALPPIRRDDAEYLVKCVPGAAGLPVEMVRDIAARADGIPLFIEELTKAVVETAPPGRVGAATPRAPVIPSSLQASLTARLDRLGETRKVASVAAALGREFASDLLLAVMPMLTSDDLRAALERLVQAELVSPSASSAQAFMFRHALIQDAAYGMLPRDERKALHRRIALALEERFSEVIAAQPEIAADHFTKADLPEPAIRYLTQAGHRAAKRSALVDAAKHYSEAIALVRGLPASAERDRTELGLHLALGPVTMATEGYAAAATLQTFMRAQELAAPSATSAQQLEILAGLFNVHYGRAELEQAQAVARKHWSLATHGREAEARAHCFMGQTHSAQGEFELAKTHFERTLAIFADNAEDVRALGVYGSQYVVASAFLAGIHWALGDPEKAAASTAASIAYARESGHLVSIALALITRLLTPIPGGLKGDPAEAEEVLQFCARHRLSNFEIWARFAQGAIMARRGELRAGIQVMETAIGAAEESGSRLFRPVQLATVASTYARLNEVGRAVALLDEAIVMAQRTGERRADSALHRLRGEILIAAGRTEEGGTELMRSLEIARTQRAKSEEERTEKAIVKLVRR